MASRQPVPRPVASNMSQVRRNLFHGNLSRRPTSASTSTSTTMQLDPIQDSSSEIIMRDPQGNYQIYIPTLPLAEEQAQAPEEGEAQSMEARLETKDCTDFSLEVESRLLELLHNRHPQTVEPAELLTAVQSSLKKKVTALEEDNWMYEGDK
ncbi:MAG: hypothetical protein MMC33_003073 [Icmadophila ericetorum]|nr:hypothetical protein [Icmadophila ericetorum]